MGGGEGHRWDWELAAALRHREGGGTWRGRGVRSPRGTLGREPQRAAWSGAGFPGTAPTGRRRHRLNGGVALGGLAAWEGTRARAGCEAGSRVRLLGPPLPPASPGWCHSPGRAASEPSTGSEDELMARRPGGRCTGRGGGGACREPGHRPGLQVPSEERPPPGPGRGGTWGAWGVSSQTRTGRLSEKVRVRDRPAGFHWPPRGHCKHQE